MPTIFRIALVLLALLLALMALVLYFRFSAYNTWKRAQKTLIRKEYGDDEFYKVLLYRQALRNDMTVEEYEKKLEIEREAERKEAIEYFSRELQLTPEEVVTQGLDAMLRGTWLLEVRARKLSKEKGRKITAQELMKEIEERMSKSNFPGPNCLSPGEIEEYAETGTLPDERLSHLEECVGCAVTAEGQREGHLVWNATPGPECFTKTELNQVRAEGKLPKERLSHMESCKRCERHFGRAKESWIDRLVPLPRRSA